MAQEGLRGLPAQKILALSWNVVNMGQWRALKFGLLIPRGVLQLQAPEEKQSSSSLPWSSCREGGEKEGAKCALRLCFTAAGEQGACSPASLVNPDGLRPEAKPLIVQVLGACAQQKHLGSLKISPVETEVPRLDITVGIQVAGLSFGGNSLPHTHCGQETLTNHGQICIPLFGAYSGNLTAAHFLFSPHKGSVEILHAD